MSEEADLFSEVENPIATSSEPLASKMRPTTLEEYVGQEHILKKGKLLRRAIEADKVRSILLYGPAGTGKTTLARIIANTTKSKFIEINATESSVAEIRKIAAQAKTRLENGATTTCFIDEIHRFNKGQQDALLPYVEKGIIRLIGATTQNPFFAINAPLISRQQVFQLEPLSKESILTILQQAVTNPKKGYGNLPLKVTEDAYHFLAESSDGDARRALGGLELAVLTTEPDPKGEIHIDLEIAQESIQKKAIVYDREGDSHYDTISAFIKSMRGSDPNATLYWLAKMLEAGEEPRYIARRIVIHAAEDVGLADPSALQSATAAQSAVETIGLPEAKIPLAMAALHVALAPKSNSACKGIAAATSYVRENPLLQVPKHLRDTHYEGAQKLGHGNGYLYPHNYPHGYVEQDYLPEKLVLYHPSQNGVEKTLTDELQSKKDKTTTSP